MTTEFFKTKTSYIRNLIFGAEDSLVSTVGVLFGIASTSYDKKLIMITGLLVITVEALSMGAGAFLSEESAEELNEEAKSETSTIVDGIIMFLSYFFAGFIPLFPYLVFDIALAKAVSIIFSLLALFLLGYIPSKKAKSGLRMTLVAGLAILVGFLIGNFMDNLN